MKNMYKNIEKHLKKQDIKIKPNFEKLMNWFYNKVDDYVEKGKLWTLEAEDLVKETNRKVFVILNRVKKHKKTPDTSSFTAMYWKHIISILWLKNNWYTDIKDIVENDFFYQ